MGDKCRCSGLQGLDLALCLAPPRGEYETVFDLSRNTKLVVSKDGIFIRRIVADDFLPFINTIDKRATPQTLKAYGVRVEDILCENVKQLVKASQMGSVYAKKLLEDCSDVVRKILEDCGLLDILSP